MLSLLFRSEVPIEQSHRILSKEYGFRQSFLSKEARMKSWALDIENEGYDRGLKQGRTEGRAEGKTEGLCDIIKRMMDAMGKTLEDTMTLLRLTDDEKHSVRACFSS